MALCGDTSLLVQMHQARAEILPPPLNRLVVLPLVCAKGLCNGVVGTVAKAFVPWISRS